MKNHTFVKNIPNIITSTRIGFAILLIFTTTFSKAFFVIYSLAAFTDMVDGFLARKLNAVSKLGSVLDSISDLLLFTIMMIKMIPSLKLYLPKYCWTMIFSVLFVRICMYLYVWFKEKRFMSSHSYFNKSTGFSLFFVPYIIRAKFFAPYATTVCLISVVAAAWDIKLISDSVKVK